LTFWATFFSSALILVASAEKVTLRWSLAGYAAPDENQAD
jgi:hypothetical protein